MEAREEFTNITESQIKCAAGLKTHIERIKVTDKGNTHAVCLSCDVIATWEHVMLCKKMKNKRDDWVNKLNKKLNYAVKNLKALTYERKTFNEIIKDVRIF